MPSNNNNKNSNDEKEYERKVIRIALFTSLGVISIWALTFVLYSFFCSMEERGQFGDMFGAVNALFSGLAFAGLIITLILQKRELTFQRDDLKQTRKEFFEVKGSDVFIKLYMEQNNFNDNRGLKGFLSVHGIDELLSYPGISVLNHYFNFFDGILRYVDTSDLLEDGERYQYIVMLRNMLSDNERNLLFYYYASCGGWHKDIAEQYALFYDINIDQLSSSKDRDLYLEGAFNHVEFPPHLESNE